ncbi:MAG: hypothetical protein WAU65_02420 [Candidatus Nanoarchaeia archaeon]
MKNQRGWIRIVEAFVAVLLIGAVLVIVIDQQNNQQATPQVSIYNYEIYILRTIELNYSMRGEIISSTPPLNWKSYNFPSDINNTITSLTPSSLVCVAQICLTTDLCQSGLTLKKDIYAQSVFITAIDTNYSPKQLKLFCWAKQ